VSGEQCQKILRVFRVERIERNYQKRRNSQRRLVRHKFSFLEKMVWVGGNEFVATLRDDLRHEPVNTELSIYGIIKEDEATDFEILITIQKIALHIFVSVIPINVAKAQGTTEIQRSSKNVGAGLPVLPSIKEFVGDHF